MASPNESFGTRTFLNRLIILGFMVLVGYCMAKSIQSRSVMGIILALTSLGAGIYFLYLVAKAKEPASIEQSGREAEQQEGV
jgi:hypothetical protein